MPTPTHVCPPTQCPYANCKASLGCPGCIGFRDLSNLFTTHMLPVTHTLQAVKSDLRYFWEVTTRKFL